MTKCAENLGVDNFKVIEIKCLTKQDNPRSKTWKVSVPTRLKDIMMDPSMYYNGWTHRVFTFRPDPRRNATSLGGGVGSIQRPAGDIACSDVRPPDSVAGSDQISLGAVARSIQRPLGAESVLDGAGGSSGVGVGSDQMPPAGSVQRSSGKESGAIQRPWEAVSMWTEAGGGSGEGLQGRPGVKGHSPAGLLSIAGAPPGSVVTQPAHP